MRGNACGTAALTLAVCCLLPSSVPAQPGPGPVLRPLRIDAAPVLDGILDEPFWAGCPAVTEFATFYPDFGRPPSAPMRVAMAYDRDNLHFAFRCLEDEPDKIKSSLTSRDNLYGDDWVCLNLDTFGDQQSLYAFYVNPAGVQGDSRFAAGNEDQSVDLVWHSAGRVDEQGYTVEMTIPLQSIRFAAGDTVRMAVFFERYVSRRSEHQSYPPMDPAKGMAILTQMAPMHYAGLRPPRLLELLPAVTYQQIHERREDRLEPAQTRRELSLTAKYGLASDLVLDATVNPDFSQVEADAGQVDVNLRYDLFYAEKRPFFLEGRENFTLGGTSVSEVDPFVTAVHTRRIVDPQAGLKVTGKLTPRTTVASLYALDELPDGDPQGDTAKFAVLRLKQAVRGDDYLGALYTGREATGACNRVGGIDGQVRVSRAAAVTFGALASRTRTPDQDQARDGHALALRLLSDNRDLTFAAAAREISRDFDTQTGYLTRAGVRQFSLLARPKLYTADPAVQRIDLEGFSAQTQDLTCDRWETFNHVSGQVYFGGTSTVKVKYSYATEIFAGSRFEVGGYHAYASSQFGKRILAAVLYRRIGAINYDPADPYQGWSNRWTAEVDLQPTDQLALSLSYIRFDFHRDADDREIFDYPIKHAQLTYQLNRCLFLRGIGEYNDYRDELLLDLLASFTYIPGTVLHVGYGSLRDRLRWDARIDGYAADDDFHEQKRALFVKASYLWRL